MALHSPPADGNDPRSSCQTGQSRDDLDSATGAAAEQIGRGRRLVVIAADTSVGTISTTGRAAALDMSPCSRRPVGQSTG